ncbi:MAG TPA: acyl-CoA dehydrogenase family protein [Nocardioides sp.]
MDFTFTPEQEEAAALAGEILGDHTGLERLRVVEAAGDRFDAELWADLGSAGLLSLAVPEEYGGAGLGVIELCRVLVEVGRTVAPVPLATHGACALAVAELGSTDQRSLWLYGAATGERLLTAAVAEDRDALPVHPATTATPAGDRWTLDGVKTVVRAGTHADLFLVTATTPTGPGVFLVEPPGLVVEPQHTSDGDVAARVTFAGVPAERLGGPEAAERLAQLLTVAECAELQGVSEGALRLTTAYAKERQQFERPIATFQSVAHRLADGHIDVLFSSLTLWQAAWRLSERLPAAVEVATAKLWAADAAHRLAHTTVHVHGGVGIDLDGVAFRYFTAAKRFEFLYGGATEQALAVGRALAADPA